MTESEGRVLRETEYTKTVIHSYKGSGNTVSTRTKKCAFCGTPREAFAAGNGSLAHHLREECEAVDDD